MASKKQQLEKTKKTNGPSEKEISEKVLAMKKERADKCAKKINEVLKAHNCSLQTSLPLMFQGQPLSIDIVPLG